MSLVDKFLNVIKLNDDDDDEYIDDDEYLDEEDPDYDPDEEDDTHGRLLFRRRRQEDDEPFDDEDEEAEDDGPSSRSFGRRKESRNEPSADNIVSRSRTNNKILPMRSKKSDREEEAGMTVCVIKPHSMEDAKEITEELLGNCTVILNLEGLELDLAQRLIDFASGSCYAIDGNLQKISNYIFVITPASIEITGDFENVLAGAFDVPIESRG